MSWPTSQDYNEAVQSPRLSFADGELQLGEAVTNVLGLPIPRSGSFADVYEFHCPKTGNRWAVKCFTREVPGLQERYHAISEHLAQAALPFMVDFQYLSQGIRIRGHWFPILKMRWVAGFTLNEFVRENVEKRPLLEALIGIWLRMGKRLREANLAHGDLQHGNVLLVPGSTANALGVRLIDYDGMFVPALAQKPSGEVGHPAYQHPQRLRSGLYTPEIDRFPLLAITTALRCLVVGGKPLWDRFDTGDNLLFREVDFRDPDASPVFHELRQLDDPVARTLVNELALAVTNDPRETIHVDERYESLAASRKVVSESPRVVVEPLPIREQSLPEPNLPRELFPDWLKTVPAPAPPPESIPVAVNYFADAVASAPPHEAPSPSLGKLFWNVVIPSVLAALMVCGWGVLYLRYSPAVAPTTPEVVESPPPSPDDIAPTPVVSVIPPPPTQPLEILPMPQHVEVVEVAAISPRGTWFAPGVNFDVVGDAIRYRPKFGEGMVMFGDPTWTDYDFEATLTRMSADDRVSFAVRITPDHEYVMFTLSADQRIVDAIEHYPGISPARPLQPPVASDATPPNGERVRVRVRGQRIEAYRGEQLILAYQGDRLPPRGGVGFRAWSPLQGGSEIRNIRITSADGKVLWEGVPDPRQLGPGSAPVERVPPSPLTGRIIAAPTGQLFARAAIIPDGSGLLTARSDGTIEVRSLSGEMVTGTITFGKNRAYPNILAVAPNSRWFIVNTGGREKSLLRQIDLTTRRELLTIDGELEATETYTAVAISPDSSQMAAATAMGRIQVWDLVKKEARFTITQSPYRFRGMAYSSDGTRLLATADTDETPSRCLVRLYNAETGVPDVTLLDGEETDLGSFTMDANGKYVVGYYGSEREIRVWNLQSRRVVRRMANLPQRIGRVVSGPGNMLVSAAQPDGHFGERGDVRIWDVTTGKEQVALLGHHLGISDLSVASDGRTVVARTVDGTLVVWRLPASLDAYVVRRPAAVEAARSASSLPLPIKAEQDRANKLIRDRYKTEFAAGRSSLQRKQFAALLLEKSGVDDPAEEFMMIRLTIEQAIQAGDPELAMDGARRLEERFAGEPLQPRLELLRQLVPLVSVTNPEVNRVIVETGLDLVDAALTSDQHELANRVLDIAQPVTNKTRNVTMYEPLYQLRRRWVQELRAAVSEATSAREKLQNMPNDADAAFIQGRYLATMHGRWNEALPFLMKSTDVLWQGAVRKDLAGQTDTASTLAAADAWWDLADMLSKGPGPLPSIAEWQIRERAAHWYESRFAQLGVNDFERVRQRLGILSDRRLQTRIQSASTIALFNGRDTREWVMFGTGLRPWNIAGGLLTGTSRVSSPIFYTRRSDLRNFRLHLVMDRSVDAPGNGLLLRFGTHGGTRPEGYKISLNSSTIGSLSRQREVNRETLILPADPIKIDPRKPVTMDVVVKEFRFTVWVNGQKVLDQEDGAEWYGTEGAVGLNLGMPNGSMSVRKLEITLRNDNDD